MSFIKYLRYLIVSAFRELRWRFLSPSGSAAYWSVHMVPTEDWVDKESSLDHLLWRNAQYPGYDKLMPVHGADDQTVVDYGCGPGNDLLGFGCFSKPKNLIGIDVSEKALASSDKRIKLHRINAELIHIEENRNEIPLESNTVDLVHSSGVLHHVHNLNAALMEIHRILKPGGRLQVMVYNYQSLWVHLYTAYVYQIEMGRYANLSLAEAFKRTTDGASCPISNYYVPDEFLKLVTRVGFEGQFKGASISLTELKLLPKRFNAIQSKALASEHRDFLSQLTFNTAGQPIYDSHVAGINACFYFIKK